MFGNPFCQIESEYEDDYQYYGNHPPPPFYKNDFHHNNQPYPMANQIKQPYPIVNGNANHGYPNIYPIYPFFNPNFHPNQEENRYDDDEECSEDNDEEDEYEDCPYNMGPNSPNNYYGDPNMYYSGGPNNRGPNNYNGGPNNYYSGPNNCYNGGPNNYGVPNNHYNGGPNNFYGGPNNYGGSSNYHSGGPNHGGLYNCYDNSYDDSDDYDDCQEENYSHCPYNNQYEEDDNEDDPDEYYDCQEENNPYPAYPSPNNYGEDEYEECPDHNCQETDNNAYFINPYNDNPEKDEYEDYSDNYSKYNNYQEMHNASYKNDEEWLTAFINYHAPMSGAVSDFGEDIEGRKIREPIEGLPRGKQERLIVEGPIVGEHKPLRNEDREGLQVREDIEGPTGRPRRFLDNQSKLAKYPDNSNHNFRVILQKQRNGFQLSFEEQEILVLGLSPIIQKTEQNGSDIKTTGNSGHTNITFHITNTIKDKPPNLHSTSSIKEEPINSQKTDKTMNDLLNDKRIDKKVSAKEQTQTKEDIAMTLYKHIMEDCVDNFNEKPTQQKMLDEDLDQDAQENTSQITTINGQFGINSFKKQPSRKLSCGV